MDSVTDPPCGGGCPIRKSSDQSLLAAPQGLSQRATSFIASRRQGIHQMPFSHSPRPSGKNRQRPEIKRQRSEPIHDPRPPASVRPPTGAKQAYPCWAPPSALQKERGGKTAPVPVSRPPRDKPRAAGCTSPPYDVTCKRKVAATAATDGHIHTKRMSQAPSFTAPELTTFPGEGKQRPGLVGPGRLERPTSRLSGVRSNQLSYGPSQRPEARSWRAENCIF
jgi:hypothetical protein